MTILPLGLSRGGGITTTLAPLEALGSLPSVAPILLKGEQPPDPLYSLPFGSFKKTLLEKPIYTKDFTYPIIPLAD